MKDIELLIEITTKLERQDHLNLQEPCLERGGCSTNHKGVLAEFLNTTIPNGRNGIHLCHACHNGKCSNARHLYWGTPAENVEDAIQNGSFGVLGKGGYKLLPMPTETRKKISETLQGRPSNNKLGLNGDGVKGYRYKRKYKQIWINNGEVQTRIKFDTPIPNGYTKGKMR
ncbi:hypothetical protein UFOVP49_41 [uncultured Caudovirales phage]|uniref:Uncharacterized protein n=1 Tax=uncultured Caudovirales phage TaxID=2100421 RepID=A0A6J5KVV2_9CAUD|nr:hypothetical protein UFOVP49_41 [uncultured Caudovirales phage]